MLNICQIKKYMPKVGDACRKRLEIGKPTNIRHDGVVVSVNDDHCTYIVEFDLPGGKCRQTYSAVDDVPCTDIHEYWSHVMLYDSEEIRDYKKKNGYQYVGSSIPRLIKNPESKEQNIHDVITLINNYNKQNHTNLTYGQYVSLMEKRGFADARERIKRTETIRRWSL